MDTRTAYKRDMIGAALMIALGAAVVVVGTAYRMGSLTRMGAGYVPVVIGALLVLVGVLIAVTTRRAPLPTASLIPTVPVVGKHGGWAGAEWRGWGCILAGVAAFVLLGTHGGLVPATFAAVFISALGDRNNTVRDAALLAAGITVAGVLIFSWGLKLVFPLFTWS